MSYIKACIRKNLLLLKSEERTREWHGKIKNADFHTQVEFLALIERERKQKEMEKIQEATCIISQCAEVMTTEQLSKIRGIRAWLEGADL